MSADRPEFMEPVDIAGNFARIRERIAEAARRVGRRAEEIRLVAVTKKVEPARICQALAAGVTDLGENYVQEMISKCADVEGLARWHLIGHLQSNKAAQAARIFDMIQTIDSLRLAEVVGRHAQQLGRTIEVLLQINTSGEESKHGIAPEQAEQALEAVVGIPGISVQGLMSIGRWELDPERARPEFRLLASVAERITDRTGMEMKWLSMGMSHDFEAAIEEGANLVRIGTGIFGLRK